MFYLVIGFEHVLATIQLMISWIIPKVPDTVKANQRAKDEITDKIIIRALAQTKKRVRHKKKKDDITRGSSILEFARKKEIN